LSLTKATKIREKWKGEECGKVTAEQTPLKTELFEGIQASLILTIDIMFSFPIWETLPFPAMPSIPKSIGIPAVYLIPIEGLRYYSSGEFILFQGSIINPVINIALIHWKKKGRWTFYSQNKQKGNKKAPPWYKKALLFDNHHSFSFPIRETLPFPVMPLTPITIGIPAISLVRHKRI
jgi:hypothetical protein